MMDRYLIGIDQSTQGTKAMMFDREGRLLARTDKAHAQKIDHRGWVEHDPEEIYKNTIEVVRKLLEKTGIPGENIAGVGISNQRETAVAWNRRTGKPVYNAIVWQCARGKEICDRLQAQGLADEIRRRSGLPLSPYFSAAKLAWIFENVDGVKKAAENGDICCGNVDSFLIFRLTGGKEFRTDYSNASRTQLFHLKKLSWDEKLCGCFGIPVDCLPKLTDSDGWFGETDFEGVLPRPVPVHSVLGDSHGALLGQGCLSAGMMKATYGTGSSIMMNTGERPVFSCRGVVTSLAWKLGGKVQYVLEGNINYTGAVITWLKDQVGILEDPALSGEMAAKANPEDRTCLVPAFSGLGAPYWRSDVLAAFCGMSRTTGKNELVRAGLECIAYQITDIVRLMQEESGIEKTELRVDGGPTRNQWLMQFQSDILNSRVLVPRAEELSGIGAAYAAGLGMGFYGNEVFRNLTYTDFLPAMEDQMRREKYEGWKRAVRMVTG